MAHNLASLGFNDREARSIETAAARLGADPFAVANVAYSAHALGSIDTITIASVTGAYRSATRSYVGA